MQRDAKILILGAGPGGLSAAYFLRKHGFHNVTVFEKLGRVGGMCCTVTEHQHPFDLGALIVAPDYGEVLRLAREVGAELEKFGGITAFTFDEATQSARFRGLIKYVVGGSSWSACFRFARLGWRYLWKRHRLRQLFEHPGWCGISDHPELHVPFSRWLGDSGLTDLARFFEIPITSFGYGSLDEIPAPYALKYMSVLSFIAGVLCLSSPVRLLPARLSFRCFKHGFQRFWERVAWNIDVRVNVDVRKIERHRHGIEVTFTSHGEQREAETPAIEDRARFDYLIVACPMMHCDLSRFFKLDNDEGQLAAAVQCFPNVGIRLDVADLKLPKPMAVHVPASPVSRPLLLWQPSQESLIVGVLTRLANGRLTPDDERQLRDQSERYVTALGGRIVEPGGRRPFHVWPYFKHVGVKEFRERYFDRWERLQGKHRTFYAGGLFDFDYVEGTVRYSRHLVERYFLDDKADPCPSRKPDPVPPENSIRLVAWFGRT